MKVHKETPFIFVPLVLILDIILLLVTSFAGYPILVFVFSLILSMALLSHLYLNAQYKKVTWSYKMYHDSSSIDDKIECYIEVENHSSLPIYHLKLNIESKSEQELVFTDGDQCSSMLSIHSNLPRKSKKTIVVSLKGVSRGYHQWSNLEIIVRDPLLLQAVRLEYEQSKLPRFKIVPKMYKLNDLKLTSMLQGFKTTNHSLFMDETSIIGTKEYENESFRHIHWLASAKENKLLAKKYQKVHGDLYSIFLNLVGAGPFHLRRDLEELIEYTVAVCIHLIKEGCKVELWVNYSTGQHEILRLKNDGDTSQLRKIITSMALINPNGTFFPTDHFFAHSIRLKDSRSMGLIIGNPPEPRLRDQLLHIRK
ncbi:DUF58 domain-containing protein [Rossellomorea aquimaris]|uniref:DUF58 domain-containing protein n=1 Tax=Rossellomorea aquimaris TaxID=189382 RepID=UPI001CD238E8|nr:DUF58 domain-containing protein [Rossellomorea aquimaris]MCA1053736.1 DUF58 domain-containing protein [Rossellomorea aquimaris]